MSDHLAFTVSDLDRTTAWYCRHLGFEPLIRYTNSEIGAEVQVLQHADLSIRLSFRRFNAGNSEPFTSFGWGWITSRSVSLTGLIWASGSVGSVDPVTGKINIPDGYELR